MKKVILLLFILISISKAEVRRVANDIIPNLQFGISVSVDENTVVVGAQGWNSRQGAAYIFYRNEGGTNNWGQMNGRITASDGSSQDRFGASIDIYGDIMVVGAPRAYNRSGRAYVYYRNLGGTDNWGEVTILSASDGQDFDAFGVSVAVYDTVIVIGADQDDTNDIEDDPAGKAYIFYRNAGGTDNWGEVKIFSSSDSAASDRFGHDVAVSEDIIAVGAWGDDSTGNNSGAVYLFQKNQGGADNWGEIDKKVPTSPGEGSLGKSLAIDGDHLIAGAPLENEVYFYYRHQGGQDNWGQLVKFNGTELAAPGELLDPSGTTVGSSVDIRGTHAITGAPGDSPDEISRSGSFYTFYRIGLDWSQEVKEVEPEQRENNGFGSSVATDGITALAATTSDSVGTQSNVGSVYIYDVTQDLALPVELSTFGITYSNIVELSWETKSEIENVGFQIWRSNDKAGPYNLIASYSNDDRLRGQGNSSISHDYRYEDHDILIDQIYWYKLISVDYSGMTTEYGPKSVQTTTDLSCLVLELKKNYPNPFNSGTRIDFAISSPGNKPLNVELSIFNTRGQKMIELISGKMNTGSYSYYWDGNDYKGNPVSSGVYLYQLRSESYIQTNKMIIVK